MEAIYKAFPQIHEKHIKYIYSVEKSIRKEDLKTLMI